MKSAIDQGADMGHFVSSMVPAGIGDSSAGAGAASRTSRWERQRLGDDGARAPAYRDDLPWAEFAEGWGEAESRIACLERDLNTHELRPFWGCRTDMQMAAALASLRGDPVAMDDLVLVDAGVPPRWRPSSWVMAKTLLALRRHIADAGPARVMTVDGILDLEVILAMGLIETLPAGRSATPPSQPHKVERWLTVVDQLSASPPLPAAAIALRSWRRIVPLSIGNHEIGLLLASTLLWHWGKTTGLTVCPIVGMQSAGQMDADFHLDDRCSLGSWILQFCCAVQASAESGLDSLEQIEATMSKSVKLLQGHRSNSRIPQVIRLFLSYPVMTTRFISQQLQVSIAGAEWLLKELLAERVIVEATGRAKNRAYRLA